MNSEYKPNDYLPEGIEPYPSVMVGGCGECGGDVHIYESQLEVRPDGTMRCTACVRRRDKKLGRDNRRVDFHHKFKFNENPADDDADPDSSVHYLKLEMAKAHPPDQRSGLGGGPESPFPCEKCGSLLRAVSSASVGQVLKPLGYKPIPGTREPKEKIVILMCPYDKPEAHHPFLQIRESFLNQAMEAKARSESH